MGSPIVLMHGAGSHLLSLGRLATALAPYRVVTMDQRWSGQSGDSDTYDWADLVADVESVVRAFGMEEPAVGGHSWGGMIAMHYSAAHPEASAVFNLDGHGQGDRSLYDGLSDADYAEGHALLAALQASGDDSPREGDTASRPEAWARERASMVAMGVSERSADAWADRNFLDLGGGRWRRHPSPAIMQGLEGDLEMFATYRRVKCPALTVLSSTTQPGLPDAVRPLMEAYYRGLRRAFGQLEAEHPNFRTVSIPESDHISLVVGHAVETADAVKAFLADSGYDPER